MFTIQQIKETHARVQSGADFRSMSKTSYNWVFAIMIISSATDMLFILERTILTSLTVQNIPQWRYRTPAIHKN